MDIERIVHKKTVSITLLEDRHCVLRHSIKPVMFPQLKLFKSVIDRRLEDTAMS